MNKNRILIKFRIYPGKGSYDRKEARQKGFTKLYWDIIVMRDTKAMYEVYDRLSPMPEDKNFHAIVSPVETQTHDKKKWVVLPSLGFALFYAGMVPGEVIAHESVHMAMNYWRRADPKRIQELEGDDMTDKEEHLAYIVGYCAQELTNRFHKAGFYTKKFMLKKPKKKS